MNKVWANLPHKAKKAYLQFMGEDILPSAAEVYVQKEDFHRLDGPAVRYMDHGHEMHLYWSFGLLHRTDGPAVERPGRSYMGHDSFYVHGCYLLPAQFEKAVTKDPVLTAHNILILWEERLFNRFWRCAGAEQMLDHMRNIFRLYGVSRKTMDTMLSLHALI